MNKFLHLVLVGLLMVYSSAGLMAQNSVGIGTATPNTKAVLELVSPGNNQGFLTVRLTTAQRTALASSLSNSDNGLLIYDTGDSKFYYWQTSQWLPIKSGVELSVGAGLTLTGNTIAAIPDGDGDATNEIQDLQLTGSTLTVTNNPSATPINLSAFTGTNSDDQTLTYNSSTGQLTISRLSGNQSQIITTAGTASGDLTGSYPSPTIANSAINSAKIADGSVATADLANSSVTAAKLANTAVTVGTYGSGTQVSQITVDAQGRITNASSTPITGAAPVGAASGDLSGNYPGPTIVATAGNNVVAAINNAATAGVINTGRLATAVVLDSESPSGGDVSGNFSGGLQINANTITSAEITDGSIATADLANNAVTAAKLANTTVAAGSYGSATQVSQITVDAQGRITNASSVAITASPTGAASGDLTGNYPAPTINNSAGSGTNIVNAINNAGATGTINSNRLNSTVVLDSEAPAAGDVSGNFSTGLQINANAVTNAEIADGTVGTLDLANTAVTDAKIAAGVAVSKLVAGGNTQVLTTTGGVPTWQAPVDNSATNEIQTLAFTSPNISISSGNSVNISGINTDNQNLALGVPSGVNRTINISGGTGVTFSVADNDNSSSNEIQNLADVLSTGNDAQGRAAVNLSALSINSTATPGSLNVNGSHYMSFIDLPPGQEIYDVKDDDYIIYGRSTVAKPYNVNLPKAASSRGRVLIIRATGTGGSDGIKVNSSDNIDGNSSTPVMYTGEANTTYAITVFCDGKEWWTISKSKF